MDVGSERSWGAGDFAVLLVYIGGTAGAGGLGAAERSEPGGRAEGGREGSERRFFLSSPSPRRKRGTGKG